MMNYTIDRVTNLGKLAELWQQDNEAYGEMSLPFEVFSAWWQAYPEGLTMLLHDGRIIGGFGMWPMAQDDLYKLASGAVWEQDVLPLREGKDHEYWYISGLMMRSEYARTRALLTLLGGVAERWKTQLGSEREIEVCAAATGTDALKLMVTAGFTQQQVVDYAGNPYATLRYRGTLENLFRRTPAA